MKTLKYIAAVALLAASTVASAKLITVTVTGDGRFVDNSIYEVPPDERETKVGLSIVNFTYDDAAFSLYSNVNFNDGTGKKFETPEVKIDLFADGKMYDGGFVTGAHVFDQYTKNDQFSFVGENEDIVLQWNERSSNLFEGGLSEDFAEISDLLIDHHLHNENLIHPEFLSLHNVNGIEGLYFDMDISDLTFSIEEGTQIPEPASVFIFGFGLLGLAGFKFRQK